MSEWLSGIHAVQALLEQRPADAQQLLMQEQRKPSPRLQQIERLAHKNNIPVHYESRQELDRLSNGENHQGVMLRCATGGIQMDEAQMLEMLANLQEPALVLLLDGIQDPHNLGAILRTADAAGVHAVIAPKDKAVGLTSTVRKVSCGATETVPFVQVTNLTRTMEALKEMGIWITGTSLDTDQNIYQIDFTGPSGLVIGAEGKGARRLTLEHCDYLMQLPMLGSVQSLNASVAAGVCLYEAVRQRIKS